MSTPCAPEEYPLITAAAKAAQAQRDSPIRAHRCHICAGTGLTPGHICTGTGPPRVHMCTGTGPIPCHICAGTGPALIATWQRRTRTVPQPLRAASPRPALPQWRSAAAVNGHSTASRGPPKRYSRRTPGVPQGVIKECCKGSPIGYYSGVLRWGATGIGTAGHHSCWPLPLRCGGAPTETRSLGRVRRARFSGKDCVAVRRAEHSGTS